MKDIPIAVMSGARRGAPRRGRYAMNSIVAFRMPQKSIPITSATSPTGGSTGTLCGSVMGWRPALVAPGLPSLGDAWGEDRPPLPPALSLQYRYAAFTRLAGGVIVLNGVVLPPFSSLYCVTGLAV